MELMGSKTKNIDEVNKIITDKVNETDNLGGICGAIKNQALKIVITILVLLVIAGVSFCAYYFGGNLIKTNL